MKLSGPAGTSQQGITPGGNQPGFEAAGPFGANQGGHLQHSHLPQADGSSFSHLDVPQICGLHLPSFRQTPRTLGMPAVDVDEMSGDNASGTWPYSLKNSEPPCGIIVCPRKISAFYRNNMNMLRKHAVAVGMAWLTLSNDEILPSYKSIKGAIHNLYEAPLEKS